MKLLATSAAALLAFAGAAYAQEVSSPSLLERVLQDAKELQLNLTNVSENYADVDADVEIDFDFEDSLEEVISITRLNDVALGLGEELDTIAISFYDPTEMVKALAETSQTISDVSNTAIGALNTGTVGTSGANGVVGAVDLVLTSVQETSTAAAGTAKSTADLYGETGLINMANLAGNYSETLDASVVVDVDGLVNIDTLSNTAIGSLNTGNIASNITANLIGGASYDD